MVSSPPLRAGPRRWPPHRLVSVHVSAEASPLASASVAASALDVYDVESMATDSVPFGHGGRRSADGTILDPFESSSLPPPSSQPPRQPEPGMADMHPVELIDLIADRYPVGHAHFGSRGMRRPIRQHAHPHLSAAQHEAHPIQVDDWNVYGDVDITGGIVDAGPVARADIEMDPLQVALTLSTPQGDGITSPRSASPASSLHDPEGMLPLEFMASLPAHHPLSSQSLSTHPDTGARPAPRPHNAWGNGWTARQPPPFVFDTMPTQLHTGEEAMLTALRHSAPDDESQRSHSATRTSATPGMDMGPARPTLPIPLPAVFGVPPPMHDLRSPDSLHDPNSIFMDIPTVDRHHVDRERDTASCPSVTDSALDFDVPATPRIDFLALLPHELSLRVISHLIRMTPSVLPITASSSTPAVAGSAATVTTTTTPGATLSVTTESTVMPTFGAAPPGVHLHTAVMGSDDSHVSSSGHRHGTDVADAAVHLMRCAAVSRTWRNLATDHLAWRTVYYARYPEDTAIHAEAPAWRLTVVEAPPLMGSMDHSMADVAVQLTAGVNVSPGQENLAAMETPASSSFSDASLNPVEPSVGRVGIEVVPFRDLLNDADADGGRSVTAYRSHTQRATTGLGQLTVPLALAVPYDARFRQRVALDRNWRMGRHVRHCLLGHADNVYCIQFAGDVLVSGSRDQTVAFWDLRSMTQVRALTGHAGSVLCLQFNAHYLVTGSSDHTVGIWDLKGNRLRTLRGHQSPVLDVRMDMTIVVSCSKDNTVRVWDIETGALRRSLVGHTAAVNAVWLHGDRCVSASGDCTLKLWEVHTGVCVREFIGHQNGLACVQYDGRIIVSGSNDKTLRVWNAETGALLHILEGHTSLVRTLCFDSERIVSGSYDHSIKVWDLRTGALLQDFVNAHRLSVFQVMMDKTRIVSAGQDRAIVVWDFACDDVPQVACFSLRAHNQRAVVEAGSAASRGLHEPAPSALTTSAPSVTPARHPPAIRSDGAVSGVGAGALVSATPSGAVMISAPRHHLSRHGAPPASEPPRASSLGFTEALSWSGPSSPTARLLHASSVTTAASTSASPPMIASASASARPPRRHSGSVDASPGAPNMASFLASLPERLIRRSHAHGVPSRPLPPMRPPADIPLPPLPTFATDAAPLAISSSLMSRSATHLTAPAPASAADRTADIRADPGDPDAANRILFPSS